MTFEEKALLEKAARFIASATLLMENDDHDSAVSPGRKDRKSMLNGSYK